MDSVRNVYVAGGQGGDPSSLWIGKFDSTGILAGSPFPLTNPFTEGNGITIDDEGNIYVAGTEGLPGTSSFGRSDCNIFVRKYDSSGGGVWTSIIDDPTSSLDCGLGYGIAVGSDGSVYVTGTNGYLPAAPHGIWIRKYTPDGTSDDGPPDVTGP